MELHQEKARWELGKGSAPEGAGHGTGCPGQWLWSQASGVQDVFRQHFQTLGLNVGWGNLKPGVGLSDLCESFPTWDILRSVTGERIPM